MAPTLSRVRVAGTGAFLPNPPVENDRIDAVLGPLDDAPLGVRTMLRTTARRLLAQSGIERRHFAVDPATGRLTHDVAGLAEQAAVRALEDARLAPADVGLLLVTSPAYDTLTPPTSARLQERLGIASCAEIEIHSNCAGVGKCMQVATDALTLGRYDTALVVAVQHSSSMLRAAYYNQARVGFEEAALRYILSDGAGAVVLRRSDAEHPPREVVGTYIESVGGRRKPGMWAGAGVADAVRFARPVPDLFEHGSHHLGQDLASILAEAGDLLLESLVRLRDALGIRSEEVRHAVFSIPSRHIYQANKPRFLATFGGDADRAKFRGADTGYCGGASLLVHLDQMARSGELASGDLAVLHAVESSKWMAGGFAVRW